MNDFIINSSGNIKYKSNKQTPSLLATFLYLREEMLKESRNNNFQKYIFIYKKPWWKRWIGR